MGYGDLVRYRKIGSNTIVKGNIEENVSIMSILPEIMTFVKFSGTFLLLMHYGKWSKGL